jgi:hypothetical protein
VISIGGPVFFKAQLAELSPAALRQLKGDIATEKKRREAQAADKAEGSGVRPTAKFSGHKLGCVGEDISVNYKTPRATAGRSKANELDTYDEGCSIESAVRCPAPEPMY